MLHAQEESAWGADKEKVKALDLIRFVVAGCQIVSIEDKGRKLDKYICGHLH